MSTAFSVSGSTTIPEILPPANLLEARAEALTVDPLAGAYHLPLTLTVDVPVVSFTVGSLMRLGVGSIVETATQQNEDLALMVNGQPVGPVEIEVLGDNLAVRLTGIA